MGQAPNLKLSSGYVTPNSSDSNSFSLSWPAVIAGEGELLQNITIVNTNPPSSYVTLATIVVCISVDGTQ